MQLAIRLHALLPWSRNTASAYRMLLMVVGKLDHAEGIQRVVRPGTAKYTIESKRLDFRYE